MIFVQSLRVFLTLVVVAHHAAQPAGPATNNWMVTDPDARRILAPLLAWNSAYFMGFFFLIAGYFVEVTIERKGLARFVVSRMIRLGLPLVLLVAVIYPALLHYLSGGRGGLIGYFRDHYDLATDHYFGPLWFVAHLLIYSLVYAAIRGPLRRAVRPRAAMPVPGHRAILIYALGLGAATAAAHLLYPGIHWVTILWVVPADPAHLPQYVSLFAIGIVAGKGQWFTRIDRAVAYRWAALGVIAFSAALVAGRYIAPDEHPRAAAVLWAVLEPFVCVGTILGLLSAFRDHLSRPGRVLAWAAASSYGVYLVHLPVIIVLQGAAREVDASAILRVAVVAVVAILASYLIVLALRLVPPIRVVIG